MLKKLGHSYNTQLYPTLSLVLDQLQNIVAEPSQNFGFLETDSRSLILRKQLETLFNYLIL